MRGGFLLKREELVSLIRRVCREVVYEVLDEVAEDCRKGS